MAAVVQLDVVKMYVGIAQEHEHLLPVRAERDENFLVHCGIDRLLTFLWTDKKVNTLRSFY